MMRPYDEDMFVALVLHVALAFQDPPPIRETVIRAAVQEAAAIWAPYGLALERAPACDTAHVSTLLLAVEVEGAAAPGRLGVVLGAIRFGPDGTPEPRVSLFLDEVRRFVSDTRVLGLLEADWPRALRDQVVGRVLGRVLAHEVGHYVLRNRQHARTGLMRPLQRSDELVAQPRHGFKLSAAEAAQIVAR